MHVLRIRNDNNKHNYLYSQSDFSKSKFQATVVSKESPSISGSSCKFRKDADYKQIQQRCSDDERSLDETKTNTANSEHKHRNNATRKTQEMLHLQMRQTAELQTCRGSSDWHRQRLALNGLLEIWEVMCLWVTVGPRCSNQLTLQPGELVYLRISRFCRSAQKSEIFPEREPAEL